MPGPGGVRVGATGVPPEGARVGVCGLVVAAVVANHDVGGTTVPPGVVLGSPGVPETAVAAVAAAGTVVGAS